MRPKALLRKKLNFRAIVRNGGKLRKEITRSPIWANLVRDDNNKGLHSSGLIELSKGSHSDVVEGKESHCDDLGGPFPSKVN